MGFADGPNPYVFVNNNPVNSVDPDGHQAVPYMPGPQIIGPMVAPLPIITAPVLQQPSINVVMNKAGKERASQTTSKKKPKKDDSEEITTFWQYFTKGWKKFKSPWFVKGKGLKPPYKLGKEAREALNLPKDNKGTAVQPYYPEKVVGPQRPKAQPEWGWPNQGKGWEYYDGDAFPN